MPWPVPAPVLPLNVNPGDRITASYTNVQAQAFRDLWANIQASQTPWQQDVNGGGHNLTGVQQVVADSLIVTRGGEFWVQDAAGATNFVTLGPNGLIFQNKVAIDRNGTYVGGMVNTPGVVIAGSHIATRGGQFWVQDAAGTVNLAILGSDGLYFQGVQSIRGDGIFVGPGIDTPGTITSHNAVVLAGGILLIRDAAQTVNKASIDASGNATFQNVNVGADLAVSNQIDGGNDLRLFNTAFMMSNRGVVQWGPSLAASDTPDVQLSRGAVGALNILNPQTFAPGELWLGSDAAIRRFGPGRFFLCNPSDSGKAAALDVGAFTCQGLSSPSFPVSALSFTANNQPGKSAIFTTADGHTVTVTNGILTGFV